MHYREEIDAICGKCEKGFSRANSTALDRGFFCCAECEDAYWSNDLAKPGAPIRMSYVPYPDSFEEIPSIDKKDCCPECVKSLDKHNGQCCQESKMSPRGLCFGFCKVI